MPVHKNIRGSAKYLPFALSKLRQLVAHAAGIGGYAARKFYSDDGTIISISTKGDQQHINISSALRYEFWTSEHINSETMAAPNHEGLDGGVKYVTGSLTRAVPNPNGPRGIQSSSIPPSSVEPTWRAADPEEPTYDKTRGWPGRPIAHYPIVHNAYATHKMFEYANWPENRSESLVISTQCLAPGLNSQAGFLSAYAWVRLENVNAFAADYGQDAHPTYYDAKTSMGGGPGYEHPDVWWRRAAVQKVGGRMFFICTDNVGRFQVYPVKDYVMDPTVPDYRALPAGMFKQFTPPYPAWVTLPVIGEVEAVTASWLWAFNKDATRCVTCAFNSTFSDDFTKPTFYRLAGGVALPEDPPHDFPVRCREDIPGLVEFSIAINVTGPGDMDFTVDFTLERETYSGAPGGQYIFDAAYTLPDKGAIGVPEDTLITAEVECFTAAGGYTPGPVEAPLSQDAIDMRGPGPQSVQAARRVESFMVIRAYPPGKPVVELMRKPLWKLAGCRFLTPAGVRRARLEIAQPYLQEMYAGQVGPSSYSVLPLEEPRDGPGGWLGHIYALELRTLSLNYQLQDQITGTMTQELWVYNQKVREFVAPYGSPAGGSYAVCDEKIPSSANYIHQYMLGTALDTCWGSGFVIHPEGHWSHSMPRGGEGADIVKFNGREETTHKALFNNAFGTEREYSFYQKYWDQDTREFTDTTGGTNIDLGSFRTTGVFITF